MKAIAIIAILFTTPHDGAAVGQWVLEDVSPTFCAKLDDDPEVALRLLNNLRSDEGKQGGYVVVDFVAKCISYQNV